MVVTESTTQREYKNVSGRSVRLAIFANDSSGKVYDIDYSDFRIVPINLSQAA